MSEVYTARTLARRWHCTPQTVYNLRSRGELTGFKLSRLWRITSQEVEAYECQTTGLAASRADGASCGKKVDADIDGALSQKMRLRRELHSETLPENVTRLHGQQGE